MEFKFRKSSGQVIKDLFTYVYQLLDDDPDIKVYIGTDSQTHSRRTTYVTAIAFRYGNNKGVHVIHTKKTVPKLGLNRLRDRLLQEFEITIKVADWFERVVGVDVEQLEVDYNEDNGDGHNQSEALLTTARGWGEGLGYKVAFKGIDKSLPLNSQGEYQSHELLAVKYADHLC